MTTDATSFVQNVSAAVAAGRPLPVEDPPPIQSDAHRAAYDALAHKIYDGMEGPAEERSRSPRGRLASRLWQRVADWDERPR
jgi:hypothetical protein